MHLDQDQILDRLQTTIRAWTDEVTQAHAELSDQIGEAREQLDILAKFFGGTLPTPQEAEAHLRDTAEMEQTVASNDAELSDLRAQLANLERERDQLRSEFDSIQVANEDVAVLEARVTSLEQERDRAQQDMADRDARIAELESTPTPEPMHDRIAELEAELETAESVRANLHAERDSLRTELIASKEAAEAARAATSDMVPAADAAALQTQLDDALLQAETARVEAEAAKSKVQAVDTSALQADLDAAQQQAEAARVEAEAAKQEAHNAEADLSNLQETSDKHKREAEALRNALQETSDALEDLRVKTEEADLSAQHALTEEISAKDAELKDLRDALERATADNSIGAEALAAQIDTLTNQLAAANERAMDAEKEIAALNLRLSDSEQQAADTTTLDALQDQRDEAMAARDAERANSETATKRAEELETELESLRRELDEAKAVSADTSEIDGLRAELHQAIRERDTHRTRAEELETQVQTADDLAEPLQKANDELATLRETLAQTEATLGERDEQMKMQDKALNDIQGELMSLMENRIPEAQHTELVGQLEEAINQLDQLQGVVAERDDEVNSLREELETIAAKATEPPAELVAELEALRAQLEAKGAEIVSLAAASEAAKASLKERDLAHATDLEARDETIASLEQQIAEAAATGKMLADREDALARVTDERDAALSQVTELETLGKEADELRAQLEAAQASLAEKDSELATANEQSAAHHDEIERLNSELAAARSSADESAAASSALVELKAAHASLQSDHEDVQRRLSEREIALAERDAEAAAVKEKSASFGTRIAELEAEVANATAAAGQSAVLEREIETLHAAKQEAEVSLANRTEETKALRAQLAAVDHNLPEKLADAEDRVAELEHALENAKQSAAAFGGAKPIEEDTVRLTVGDIDYENPGTPAPSRKETDQTIAKLRTEVAQYAAELKAVTTERNALRKELNRSADDPLKQDTVHLTTDDIDYEDRSVAARELSEARETISQLRAEIRQYVSDLKSATTERDTATLQLQELDPDLPAKHAALRREKEQADTTLQELERHVQELDKRLEKNPADLPDLYEDAITQNESLRAALVQRDADIERLRQQVAGEEDIDESQRQRIEAAAYDSEQRRRPMGEILVNAGIITPDQMEKALDTQRDSSKRRLGSILVEKGYIREEMIAQVLATQMKLPYVRLIDESIDPQALALVKGKTCMNHALIPMQLDGSTLRVAMANPHDVIAIEDIEFATHCTIEPAVATHADITSAVVRLYGVDN